MKSIPLKNGQFALIDDDDFPCVSEFRWYVVCVNKSNGFTWSYVGTYVRVGEREKLLLLHRFVMGCRFGDGVIIDHKNGDQFDCRKSNLRECSHGQNISNQKDRTRHKSKSSKFRGVWFNKNNDKWVAQIKHEKVKYNLGLFLKEKDAALAYDKAAIVMHGDFATLNFPDAHLR